MSPERFAGADANLKDDVYSFAAITYQTLTGQRPFYGGAMYQRPESLMPQTPDKLSKLAWQALQKGLAYQRENRLDNVDAVIDDIDSVDIGSKRSLLTIILMTASVLLGGWYLFNNNKAEPVKLAVIEDVVDNSEAEKRAKLARQKAALAEQKEAVKQTAPKQAEQSVKAKDTDTAAAQAEQKAGVESLGQEEVETLHQTEVAIAAAKVQLIKEIQTELNRLGFYVGRPDGVIGRRTLRSITSYQLEAGVAINSEVTQRLLSELKSAKKKKKIVTRLEKLTGKMVVIPSGRFMMGSNEGGADEKPPHPVNIASFKIGQTEVTFAQWDACVAAGGCKHKPEDEGWGRGSSPVIKVSYNDITQQYIPWLTNQTGKHFRLPSEAEWEYAARAGTTTAYSTGNCINTSQANYNGNYGLNNCGAKRGHHEGRTVKVASFAPNAYGLFDMHGNVWEWTQDCWNENYNGAPNDGGAWKAGDCGKHVLRSGSWYSAPDFLRSAHRNWSSGSRRRNDTYGFRLVQGR